MPTPHKEENIKLGDGPIQTVKVFKYLGSMFAAEGGSDTDVNNRMNVAWAKWREVSGVRCDKKMPIKLKDKIYKTIVKPATIYGSECWAVKKNDTQKLHTTEMRMLRWARGKTKKDHVKNEDIWREANTDPMTSFLRKKRLRWYGHVLRKQGRGGYHQEDVKHASARKENKWEAQENMVGQYQGGHERVQDDGRHGTKSKCVAREDKGRPIFTRRRPLGEKVRKYHPPVWLCEEISFLFPQSLTLCIGLCFLYIACTFA